MTSTSQTDSIERNILINASRERVWQSLTHAESFGTWFGADLKGQTFVPGQRTRGLMNGGGGCDSDDKWFDVMVERIEPQNLFAYRWDPYGVDPAVDYSEGEQPTLVTFTLKDAPNGTLLVVVESGFDKVPPHRRLEAFRKHTGGWEAQLASVARYAGA